MISLQLKHLIGNVYILRLFQCFVRQSIVKLFLKNSAFLKFVSLLQLESTRFPDTTNYYSSMLYFYIVSSHVNNNVNAFFAYLLTFLLAFIYS